MPKIDKRTGCSVMTTSEFWSSEAEQEGKGRNGSDLMLEFLDDMDNEIRNEENKLRNPNEALTMLQGVVKEWNDYGDVDYVPNPEQVLEVLEVRINTNFKCDKTYLKARVCSGNQVGILTVSQSSYAGSWSEPPDYELNVEWSLT